MTVLDSKKYELSAPAKLFAVITAALLTGCLWRIRGDRGFGSLWGMLAVAAGLTLLIFAVFGKRNKITYEILPVAVLAMAVTNGGWGTLNTQMGGFITSGTEFAGEPIVRTVEASPFSGLFFMLCLGFGWMPLFACLIGSLFSFKPYKVRNYILLLGVYCAVLYLCKATVSPYIVNLVSPQSTDMFEAGLRDHAIEMTAYKAYLSNFFSESAMRKVPGGRNYFACVNVISTTIAALSAIFAQRLVLKDKIAARIAFGVNAVCAVAISAADIFLVIGYENNLFHIYTVPAWIAENPWSLWEFFTGFLLGFGVMLILVLLPRGVISGDAKAANDFHLRHTGTIFVYSIIFTLFTTLCLSPVRALGIRVSEQVAAIEGLPGIIYSLASETAITVTAGLALLIICIAAAYKNIIRRRLPVPAPMSIEHFCAKRLPLFFAVCSAIYFFTGKAYLLNVNYAKITPPTLFTTLREGLTSVNIIMLICVTLFFASYAVLIRLMRKNQEKITSPN